MRMFGRELTLEQTIGFVRCNAAPNEDLVHMAALELIVALQDAQRRERAAEEDLKEASAGTCGFCRYSEYNPMRGSYPGRSCPGNQNDCNGECVNFDWRGPQVAGEGEQDA